MLHTHHWIAAITLTTSLGLAQSPIVVRDTITPLPGISICMDGATHITTVTGHRLRSKIVNLKSLEGKALEIRGISGKITCAYVDVTSATVLAAEQHSVATKSATQIKVDFFGTGATGDLYMLYLSAGLLQTPIALPSIAGPIHLDPSMMVFGGMFAPLGNAAPYKTLTAPVSPAVLNVDFLDQALVIHGNGKMEMTNVDRFRF